MGVGSGSGAYDMKKQPKITRIPLHIPIPFKLGSVQILPLSSFEKILLYNIREKNDCLADKDVVLLSLCH